MFRGIEATPTGSGNISYEPQEPRHDGRAAGKAKDSTAIAVQDLEGSTHTQDRRRRTADDPVRAARPGPIGEGLPSRAAQGQSVDGSPTPQLAHLNPVPLPTWAGP